jgi:NADPH:quinone reductase-like Zn-dependent oxidoreductase
MKAAVYYQYGPPEVIQVKDVPKPVPEDNQVLIKVVATTVSRTDCARLRADFFIMRLFTGLIKPRNPILGTDFAGTVTGLGKSVTSFEIGDRVFGFSDLGLNSQAAYLVCGIENFTSHMPINVSFQEAVASVEGAHYAINFINKVRLKAGQKVLVNGASGAIGSALVQLLVYQGLEVTATCNSTCVDWLSSIGINQVIDYQKEDFTKLEETFDYVFDAVGKSNFGKCKPLLKEKGIYISSELGPRGQNPFLSILGLVKRGKKVKFPFPHDIKGSLEMIKKMTEEGKFKPLIDREYPLTNISEAFTYVETGQKSGNVILNIS